MNREQAIQQGIKFDGSGVNSGECHCPGAADTEVISDIHKPCGGRVLDKSNIITTKKKKSKAQDG